MSGVIGTFVDQSESETICPACRADFLFGSR